MPCAYLETKVPENIQFPIRGRYFVICTPGTVGYKGRTSAEIMSEYVVRLTTLLMTGKYALTDVPTYIAYRYVVMNGEAPIPREGTEERQSLMGMTPIGIEAIIDIYTYQDIIKKLLIMRELIERGNDINDVICGMCNYMRANTPTEMEYVRTNVMEDTEKICSACSGNLINTISEYPNYMAFREYVLTPEPHEVWVRYNAFDWVKYFYFKYQVFDIFLTDNYRVIQEYLAQPVGGRVDLIIATLGPNDPRPIIDALTRYVTTSMMKIIGNVPELDPIKAYRKMIIALMGAIKILTCATLPEDEYGELVDNLTCRLIRTGEVTDLLQDIMELIESGECGLAYDLADAYRRKYLGYKPSGGEESISL